MDFCDICGHRLDRITGRCFGCETNEIRKNYPTKNKELSKLAAMKFFEL